MATFNFILSQHIKIHPFVRRFKHYLKGTWRRGK